MRALRGTAASAGYARGRVLIHHLPTLDSVTLRRLPPGQAEDEVRRLSTALASARRELETVRKQVAADIGEAAAGIFDAHMAILGDPTLEAKVARRIRDQQVGAEGAVAEEMRDFARQLASGGTYLRERALDAHDIGNRVLRHLCLQNDRPSPLACLPEGTLLLAEDLTPSDTVAMDRTKVVGIATERGGAVSHTAILARSLGVPAVIGVEGLLAAAGTGATGLLDGVKGSLVLDPTVAQIRHWSRRCRQYEERVALMRLSEAKACRLKDGTPVALMANIHQPEEVGRVADHHLEGVGLLRTELLYLADPTAPRLAVQYRHYRQVAEACGTRPVTIRTFDFAPDKHPPFLVRDTGALGLRGLRFALRHPGLLRSQLRAILRVAKTRSNLRILFPMVIGWRGLEEVIGLVASLAEAENVHPRPPVGAMIETPAAVFTLPEIMDRVDFLCIGCNDLAQYMLAVDRAGSGRAFRDCALHPALLRAVGQVIEAAAARSCPVCVCGEGASDPVVAAVLVGLGCRELSVSPSRAPEVRYALRHLSLSDARRLAERALAGEGDQAVDEMRRRVPEAFPELGT